MYYYLEKSNVNLKSNISDSIFLSVLSHTYRHATEKFVRLRDWAIQIAGFGHINCALIMALGVIWSKAELSRWYVEPMLTLFLHLDKSFLVLLLAIQPIILFFYQVSHQYPIYRFYIGKLMYDLFVINQKLFCKSLLFDTLNINRFRRLKYLWNMAVTGQHLDWAIFSRVKLESFANISPEFRFWIALVQQALALLIPLIQRSLVLGYVCYFLITIPMFWLLPWNIMWLIEYYVVSFFQVYFIANAICYLLLVWLVVLFVIKYSLKRVNANLAQMHAVVRRAGLGQKAQLYARPVNYAVRRHLENCVRMTRTNQELFGETMLMLVLMVLPSNAFIMASVLTGSSPKQLWFFISILIMVLELFLLPVCLYLPASLHATAHETRCHLLPVQFAVHRAPVVKLKLEAHFDRLVNRPRYGFSIGPLGHLTHRYIFEMLFIYAAVILFVVTRKFA